jgi:hypothetical protein
MSNVYAPCLCGSGKKLKFCCHQAFKNGKVTVTESECSKFPIIECKVLANWKREGISPVYVVRELTKDSYVFVSYLIDFWCLGLKDTIVKLGISDGELRALMNKINRTHLPLTDISYEDARSLILGAIDYAESIDIPPHASWNGIPSAFIESNRPYDLKYTFGKDGIPFYSSGPYDHELFDVEEIVEKVLNAKGEYMVHL